MSDNGVTPEQSRAQVDFNLPEIKGPLEAFVCAYAPSHVDDVLIVEQTVRHAAQLSNTTTLQMPLTIALKAARVVLRQYGWLSHKLTETNTSSGDFQHIDRLSKLLTGYSEQQRSIFLLRYVDGLSRDQIAAQLDVTLDLVKHHIISTLLDLVAQVDDSANQALHAEALMQAADWYDRQSTLSIDEQQSFSRWLMVSLHQKAFYQVASGMKQPEVYAVLLQQSGKSNAPAQDISLQEEKLAPIAADNRKRMPWVASAITVAIIGGLTWMMLSTQLANYHLSPTVYNEEPDMLQEGHYIAEIGQRMSHVLKDGSVVYLNADSDIEVNSNREVRRVKLVKGQAYFAVVHEPVRPFIVEAGEIKIEVMGTAFDVDLLGDQLVISVYEGILKVYANNERTLTKGQGAVIQGGYLVNEFFVVNQIPSWRTGWLEIKGSALRDVVLEFQRYSDKQIRVIGQGDRVITGRFFLDTPTKSLLSIATSVGANLVETEQAIILCTRDDMCTE